MAVEVKSDHCNTPAWLCDLLPRVDLDPCSNPLSNVRARRALSLENGDDGLAEPWAEYFINWSGAGMASPARSVFCNPPYSDPLPWMKRGAEFVRSGGLFIGLVKLDPTTEWWRTIHEVPCIAYPFAKRVKFEGRIWSKKHSEYIDSVTPPFCSTLLVARFPGALVFEPDTDLWKHLAGRMVPTVWEST